MKTITKIGLPTIEEILERVRDAASARAPGQVSLNATKDGLIVYGADASEYLSLRAQRERLADNRLGALSGRIKVLTCGGGTRRKVWRQRRNGEHDFEGIAEAVLAAVINEAAKAPGATAPRPAAIPDGDAGRAGMRRGA
jgi:hypothetical protein